MLRYFLLGIELIVLLDHSFGFISTARSFNKNLKQMGKIKTFSDFQSG